jgi:hypothetical protein
MAEDATMIDKDVLLEMCTRALVEQKSIKHDTIFETSQQSARVKGMNLIINLIKAKPFFVQRD